MPAPRVAGIVLAAGRGSRLEPGYKLLEGVAGRPIVTHVLDAVVGAGLDPIVVVTGYRAREVEELVPGSIRTVYNDAYQEGLSSSLRTGLASLPEDVDAALVALGDMPFVRAQHIRILLDAWSPGAIVVPVAGGRRGNPVLWSSKYFEAMSALTGDRGAKELLDRSGQSVVEVRIEDDAVLRDIDDHADLKRARSSD